MKPKSVVTCIPSKDLGKSLRFYRDGLGIKTSGIEEGMIVLEIANLSLFVMSQKSYEAYTTKINLQAGFPETKLQHIFSCALEDRQDIERIFSNIQHYGGSVAQPFAINEWGQEAGYIKDPDGHVWEMVFVGKNV